MRIALVCGGRNYGDWERVEEELEALAPEMIVHGGASGADTLGDRFALEHGLPCLRWPALWREKGRAAGFIRNREMAEFLGVMRMLGYQTLVVAFPGGNGTAHMIKTAESMSLKVWQIDDE